MTVFSETARSFGDMIFPVILLLSFFVLSVVLIVAIRFRNSNLVAKVFIYNVYYE